MSLNQQDFAAFVFNSASIPDDIRRGLEIIRFIGNSRNGVKVRQSRTFLKKLMRATLHSNETASERSLRDIDRVPSVDSVMPTDAPSATSKSPNSTFELHRKDGSKISDHLSELQPTPDDWKIAMQDLGTLWVPNLEAANSINAFGEWQHTDDAGTRFNDSFNMADLLCENELGAAMNEACRITR